MRKPGGSILIGAVIVLAVLMVITGSFISLVLYGFRQARRSYSASAAVCLAEAGVEKVMWELSFARHPWSGWAFRGGHLRDGFCQDDG